MPAAALPLPLASDADTTSAPVAEWLFARLHPRDGAVDLDATVGTVVAPAVRAFEALPSSQGDDPRWFWLRYVDHAGAHIRLRLRHRPSALERVMPVIEAAAAAENVSFGVYEPELLVYGGSEGVARAEECFEHSSRLALVVVDELPWGRERVAVAAALMRCAVAALPPGKQAAYLRGVAAYWTQGAALLPVRNLNVSVGDQWLEGSTRDLAHAWLARVSGPLDWADAPSRTRWIFRHTHLTLNRLGIPPSGEATIAASLASCIELPGTKPMYAYPDR